MVLAVVERRWVDAMLCYFGVIAVEVYDMWANVDVTYEYAKRAYLVPRTVELCGFGLVNECRRYSV